MQWPSVFLYNPCPFCQSGFHKIAGDGGFNLKAMEMQSNLWAIKGTSSLKTKWVLPAVAKAGFLEKDWWNICQNMNTVSLLCLNILQLAQLTTEELIQENEKLNAIPPFTYTYTNEDCWWLSLEMLANKPSNKLQTNVAFLSHPSVFFTFHVCFSALIRHHFETLQMCRSWRKTKCLSPSILTEYVWMTRRQTIWVIPAASWTLWLSPELTPRRQKQK